MNRLKMSWLLFWGMLAIVMAPALSFASGGAMYTARGTQFTLVGIDDGTWDSIIFCEEGVDYSSKSGCLELKKDGPAANFENNYSKYSNGACTLYAKIETVANGTGSTNDEFMLKGPTYVVVKVPKGNANCQLQQRNPNLVRSLTGIYLP